VPDPDPAPLILDGSFEDIPQSATLDPSTIDSTSPWQTYSLDGTSVYFDNDPSSAYSGSQFVELNGYGHSSQVMQTVSGLVPESWYTLSFSYNFVDIYLQSGLCSFYAEDKVYQVLYSEFLDPNQGFPPSGWQTRSMMCKANGEEITFLWGLDCPTLQSYEVALVFVDGISLTLSK
jgi:hypothetical protein